VAEQWPDVVHSWRVRALAAEEGAADWQQEATDLRFHLEAVIAAYDEFGPQRVRSEFARAVENAREVAPLTNHPSTEAAFPAHGDAS
jgi:hypothetical protein